MAWRSFAWTMICRMRILVIGGTMFMGREIVRLLVARSHDVSVLGLTPTPIEDAAAPG
jgi:uncharacterized protein YbjT (DUF2867 family)